MLRSARALIRLDGTLATVWCILAHDAGSRQCVRSDGRYPCQLDERIGAVSKRSWR